MFYSWGDAPLSKPGIMFMITPPAQQNRDEIATKYGASHLILGIR
jgi:hypothetical protein